MANQSYLIIISRSRWVILQDLIFVAVLKSNCSSVIDITIVKYTLLYGGVFHNLTMFKQIDGFWFNNKTFNFLFNILMYILQE